jgi:ABC-type phosphate/phosphonate transport system substrate-binding protein
MTRRLLAAAALLACLLAGPARAQELVFGVNEGVTYRITPQETRDRYRLLADLIARTLRRPVRVEPVDNYVKLRRNLEAGHYDLVYIHPAHHALRAIRDGKYQLVALTKGYTEYKAQFLVKKQSPLQKAVEIGDKRLVMPDPDSITAWMVRATLRDLGFDVAKMTINTTRYQDAIPFMLENGFNDVGATAANAVVKEWQAKGGRVLFASRPVPIKHFIASTRLSKAEVEAVRALLLGLETSTKDKPALTRIGFQGFVAGNEQQLTEITKWLGI